MIRLKRTAPAMACLLAFFSAPILLRANQDDVHAVIYEDLRVNTSLGAEFYGRERRDADGYERNRTVRAQGEWAPVPWFSIYMSIPYTELTRTDQDRVFYLDHVRGGLKFQAGGETFGIVGGLFGDAARGHNKAGDVPANYGYLEPYAGVYGDWERVYLTGAIRWNTETTPKFRESPQDDFRRTWLADVSTGFRLRPITLMLDARYHYTYDPTVEIKKYLEVGPGLDWTIAEGMHLTVAGIFCTKPESKNRGAVLSFRKFID